MISLSFSSGTRAVERDGLLDVGIALLWALAIASPIVLFGGGMTLRAHLRERNLRTADARLVAAAPEPVLDLSLATHGRNLFHTVCAACHANDGTGVKGIGRNLAQSNFVASMSDDELLAFIVEGRPAAKPLPMPARGGRPDLTDDDLRAIVAYMRGLQDPRRLPALPEVKLVVAAPTAQDLDAALAAAGGDAELAEYIANGKRLFNAVCIACHGQDGVGVAGNGKPLARSEWVRSRDDDALLEFLRKGRDPGDPANTTGVGMPAKGGNPAFDEDDLLDIIAYLRTLQ
jgi:disulfide bond formation protein DsbB